MKAELYKRLFRAIFSEDVSSLKKIAITVIQEERRSAELSCFWKERRAERSENALPEIKTGIPILLEIDPSADIDFLRGLGFEIVCEIEEGFIVETKKPEKSRQKAAGCRNTQEVIYTQPLFITPFYLLKGYRSDRLDINIPVIPKAARRDGFTR